MQLRTNATLCALLMLMASAAMAQKSVEVIEQQVIEIFNETVVQIPGELSEAPTPEQEAYGFDPQKILKMEVDDVLDAAKELDGSFNETINTFYVSDFAIRADIQTPMDMMNTVSYVIRRDKGVTWIILHGQKKYVELAPMHLEQSMPTMKDKSAMPKQNTTSESVGALKKTGETATINGFACERYFAKDAGGMKEVWLSSEHDDLRAAFDEINEKVVPGSSSGFGSEDERWMALPKGLPIVAKELVPGGSLSIESIKSIKRQPAEARRFEIPAGYKKITMAEMIGMQMEKDEN